MSDVLGGRSTQPVARAAARVLLLDGRDRVLLFRGGDPGRPGSAPYWFTVGGGLDPGESPRAGAVRETREETGLRLAEDDLCGPVWHEVVEFPFEGQDYRQTQDFFYARVEQAAEPGWAVDTSGFGPVEERSVDAHRWWSVAELAATRETYYPPDLVPLLRRVLAGEVSGP